MNVRLITTHFVRLGICLSAIGTATASNLPTVAENQNWSELSSQIAAKADVTATQPDGSTALHWAAYHDHREAVIQLLAAGAKVDAANRYGITPLLLACESGSEVIVRALLAAGADANGERKGGESAMMVAARTGKPGAVQALLEKGAKVEARDRTGQTALMWAAAEGHGGVIGLLVQNGADVKHRLKSGFTPLLFAAREGKTEAVRALLKAGADVNEVIVTEENTGGRSAGNGTGAVLFAVENGHFELAHELVLAGADPNDARSGYTPLHTLTWVRKPDRGDGVDGQPPPETHGRLTSLDLATRLVEAGADVNAKVSKGRRRNTQGATPFLMACKTADIDYLKRLLELGADPEMTDADDSTAMILAAGLGTHAPDEVAGTEDECLEVVAFLHALGADVNAVNKRGETAMHGAAYKSLPKVIHWLDEHGADIAVWNQKNRSGWTPLLIAQGFRPGNFRPLLPAIEAISDVMKKHGVEPPSPPDRNALPKKKGYQP